MEELDLKELFLIFWNRKLEILLITIIALIVGVLYSYFYLIKRIQYFFKKVLTQSPMDAIIIYVDCASDQPRNDSVAQLD